MSNSESTHIEARIWHVVSTVGIVFTDRFLNRLFPVAILMFFVFLYEPAYGDATVIATLLLASVWAILDLARGIELDHQYRDDTLRETVLDWYHEHRTPNTTE